MVGDVAIADNVHPLPAPGTTGFVQRIRACGKVVQMLGAVV